MKRKYAFLRAALAASTLSTILAACSSANLGQEDASVFDAQADVPRVDVSLLDGGRNDAHSADAANDGALPDAGVDGFIDVDAALDAGIPTDAAFEDGGVVDGGPPDANSSLDAAATDAFVRDGAMADASTDAGVQGLALIFPRIESAPFSYERGSSSSSFGITRLPGEGSADEAFFLGMYVDRNSDHPRQFRIGRMPTGSSVALPSPPYAIPTDFSGGTPIRLFATSDRIYVQHRVVSDFARIVEVRSRANYSLIRRWTFVDEMAPNDQGTFLEVDGRVVLVARRFGPSLVVQNQTDLIIEVWDCDADSPTFATSLGTQRVRALSINERTADEGAFFDGTHIRVPFVYANPTSDEQRHLFEIQFSKQNFQPQLVAGETTLASGSLYLTGAAMDGAGNMHAVYTAGGAYHFVATGPAAQHRAVGSASQVANWSDGAVYFVEKPISSSAQNLTVHLFSGQASEPSLSQTFLRSNYPSFGSYWFSEVRSGGNALQCPNLGYCSTTRPDPSQIVR